MGCTETPCTNGIKGKPGQPGTSFYLYTAYASSKTGSDFSLIPSENLKWIQFLVRNTPATTLTLADFPGTWIEYIGTHAGNSDDYKFSASLTGDPGSGKLLVDNANMSAVTSINISKTDLAGANMAAWLQTISTSTSTSKALVKIIKNDGNKAFFSVTGYSATPTYVTLTVTVLGLTSNSPFLANDVVSFGFSVVGNKGADGGIRVLHSDPDQTDCGSTSTGVFTPLKTYTMPGGTMQTNGDWVEIDASGVINSPTIDRYMVMDFGLHDLSAHLLDIPAGQFIRCRVKVTRIDANNAKYEAVWDSFIDAAQNPSPIYHTAMRRTFTFVGMDFANPIVIKSSVVDYGAGFSSGDFLADKLQVELHSKV